MAERDSVDALVDQWAHSLAPDDIEVMSDVAHVLRVAALLNARIDALAADYGVHRGEGDVIFTLRRAGEPYRLTPSQLAANLLVATATMTSRLDGLERRKLIRRIPNPQDRRSMTIELTPTGKRMADDGVRRHVAAEHEMLAVLSPRDRAAMRRIMGKLLTHLQSGVG